MVSPGDLCAQPACRRCWFPFCVSTGVLISPLPDQEGNKLGSLSGTHAFSTPSRRELSSGFFFLQDKAPKEIHPILTETLDCFLPVWSNDLSAPLYKGYRVSLPGVKQPGRGVDHLLQLTPKLKKEYSYTSTPLLGLHGLFWGELYFYFYCGVK